MSNPDPKVNASLAVVLAYNKKFPDHVFIPVPYLQKFPPCFPDFLNRGSNDPAKLRQWATMYPGCNWGVLHGASGIVVIDADFKPGKKGAASLRALVAKHGKFPKTSTVRSPSGGRHFRYKATDKVKHRFKLDAFGKSLDSPHYTIIPGCKTKTGEYVWESDLPLADAPDFFAEYLPLQAEKSRAEPGPQREPRYPLDVCAKLLAALDPEQYRDQDKWFELMCSYHFLTGGQGLADFRAWCDRDEGYAGKTHDIEHRWNSLGDRGPNASLREDLFLEAVRVADETLLHETILEQEFNDEITANGKANAEAEEKRRKVIQRVLKLGEITAKNKSAPGEVAKAEKTRRELVVKYGITEEEIHAERQRDERATSSLKIWDRECVIIVNPACFVSKRTRKILSYKAFNHQYASVGKNHDIYKTAVKSKNMPRYDGVCYYPYRLGAQVADAVQTPRGLCYNMFRPSKLTPIPEEPKIFLDHMNYLIPDETTREFSLDWLAWSVQHPELKMMFALLLLGKKRTGKSWVGDLMRRVLGEHNTFEPDNARVSKNFNAWMQNRQMIIIHELREGKKATALSDALKTYITQPVVTVEPKGIDPFEIENCANFLTITNFDDAVRVDDDEGRYLAARCADLPRFGRGTEKSKAYYKMLFASIGTLADPGDECRRVLNWLLKREIKLDCTNVAPDTEAKTDMVEAGRNPLERMLHEALENGEPPLACEVVNTTDVLNALAADLPYEYRTADAVEAALRDLGAKKLRYKSPVRTASGRKNLWLIDGANLEAFMERNPEPSSAAKIYNDGQAAQRKRGMSTAAEDFAEPAA